MQAASREPRADEPSYSAPRRASSRLRSRIHRARQIGPDFLIERREGGMHARTNRIARPRDRYHVMLRDARARSLREEVNFIRQAECLFEIMGDQKDADLFALDQGDEVLD